MVGEFSIKCLGGPDFLFMVYLQFIGFLFLLPSKVGEWLGEWVSFLRLGWNTYTWTLIWRGGCFLITIVISVDLRFLNLLALAWSPCEILIERCIWWVSQSQKCFELKLIAKPPTFFVKLGSLYSVSARTPLVFGGICYWRKYHKCTT